MLVLLPIAKLVKNVRLVVPNGIVVAMTVILVVVLIVVVPVLPGVLDGLTAVVLL